MGFNVMCATLLRRGAARSIFAAALFAAPVLTTWGASSRAQEAPAASPPAQQAPSDSPIKSVLKIVGFATDVAPPPKFVQQSRPAAPLPLIPVFAKPPEPPGKAQSAQEVQGVDNDLEAISKRDDALRSAFPPSAKAMAEAAAAKAAKAKNRTAKKGPIPTF
jgi:hypothetical protein